MLLLLFKVVYCPPYYELERPHITESLKMFV